MGMRKFSGQGAGFGIGIGCGFGIGALLECRFVSNAGKKKQEIVGTMKLIRCISMGFDSKINTRAD